MLDIFLRGFDEGIALVIGLAITILMLAIGFAPIVLSVYFKTAWIMLSYIVVIPICCGLWEIIS